MYKELIESKEDWDKFYSKYSGYRDIGYNDSPTRYPCVVVYHEYEDYYSRDHVDWEIVDNSDFE